MFRGPSISPASSALLFSTLVWVARGVLCAAAYIRKASKGAHKQRHAQAEPHPRTHAHTRAAPFSPPSTKHHPYANVCETDAAPAYATRPTLLSPKHFLARRQGIVGLHHTRGLFSASPKRVGRSPSAAPALPRPHGRSSGVLRTLRALSRFKSQSDKASAGRGQRCE